MQNETQGYILVETAKLNELIAKVDKLSEIISLNGHDKNSLGDFISENEAGELLKKKTTWFWNQRKAGALIGRKTGNTWYYKKSEIIKLIETSKQSNHDQL